MALFRRSCVNLTNKVYRRLYSSDMTVGEQRIFDVMTEKFPQASFVKVEDISGGCGAIYDVHIESMEFQNKRLVQQHMMVTKALKSEIKEMHGIRIHTSIPEQSS